MKIVFSDEFNKIYNKIKNEQLRFRLLKVINKLKEQPYFGKPLRYNLKEHRSIRIKPFRVIYRIENDSIIIICFDHRNHIYDSD